MMEPRSVRTHLLLLCALFALITLSVLAIFAPLVSGTRAASAAHTVLVGAMIEASPTSLTNCKQCTVTIMNKNPNRNLTWSATSHGIAGVTIKPAHGILQAKGKDTLDITMPANITCPANDTITITGPMNSVTISWSCMVTPTPVTFTPTPTIAPTPTPPATPFAIPTQTTTSLTPTATPVPNGGGQQNNGTPPTSSGPQGSPIPSIVLSVAALLFALLAFTLYLIPPPHASLRKRLLSLILPVSFIRRLDQQL